MSHARILCGIVLSRVSISLLNRFKILPVGVVSKKLRGLVSTWESIWAWRYLAARRVPIARYSDEMNTAMTTNTPAHWVTLSVLHSEYCNLFLQMVWNYLYHSVISNICKWMLKESCNCKDGTIYNFTVEYNVSETEMIMKIHTVKSF